MERRLIKWASSLPDRDVALYPLLSSFDKSACAKLVMEAFELLPLLCSELDQVQRYYFAESGLVVFVFDHSPAQRCWCIQEQHFSYCSCDQYGSRLNSAPESSFVCKHLLALSIGHERVSALSSSTIDRLALVGFLNSL